MNLRSRPSWRVALLGCAVPILLAAHVFFRWGSDGGTGGENAGVIVLKLAAMALGLGGYAAGLVLVLLGLHALIAWRYRSRTG